MTTPFQQPGGLPSRPEVPEGVVVHEPEPETLPRLGVPLWSPLVVVVAAFAGVLVVQILAFGVISLAGADVDAFTESDANLIGGTVVLDLALVACSVLAVAWLGAGRPTPASFGLRKPEWAAALGWTLAVYACFWTLAIIVALVFGEPEDQDIVTELKAEDSVLVLASFGVMTCLLAPLAEEFFFRGFLFRVLRERTNLVVSLLIAGFAFGLVHLPSGSWIAVLVLTGFGIALCVLFVLTSSLLPCIMLHAFHNSISFGFTKELPWWGFLLVTVGSVMTTLAIALLASRAGARRVPAPA